MSRIILLALIVLGGCTHARLEEAAGTIGTTNAGASIPELPSECRKKYKHVPILEGVEARTAIIRERAVTDKANGTIALCAENYDKVRSGLQGTSQTSVPGAPSR